MVKDSVAADGITDELASSSGSAPPQRTAVGDGNSIGASASSAAPHIGGISLPPAPDKPVATDTVADEIQASGSEPVRDDAQSGPPSRIGLDAPSPVPAIVSKPVRLPPRRATLIVKKGAPSAVIDAAPSLPYRVEVTPPEVLQATIPEQGPRRPARVARVLRRRRWQAPIRHTEEQRRQFDPLEGGFGDRDPAAVAAAARVREDARFADIAADRFAQEIADRGRAPAPALPPVIPALPPVIPGGGGAPVIPGGAPPAAPLAGVVIPPIVPPGAVMQVPAGPVFGVAPAVNVSTHKEFATSFRGLTVALVDIVLEHGSIRVDGHSATIRVSERGRRARGDIAQISRFIKKRFKLGGFLGGIKMTSQHLIKHIMSNLPGTFAITR